MVPYETHLCKISSFFRCFKHMVDYLLHQWSLNVNCLSDLFRLVLLCSIRKIVVFSACFNWSMSKLIHDYRIFTSRIDKHCAICFSKFMDWSMWHTSRFNAASSPTLSPVCNASSTPRFYTVGSAFR